MNHAILRRFLYIALLNVVVGICTPAQASINPDPNAEQAGRKIDGRNSNSASTRNKVAGGNKDDDKARLTGAAAGLAAGSKRVIIETGISEPYFDEHFQLIKVIDQPGDRRIVWKYSVNEYEATVNDAVGYYTGKDGVRVDTHSIKQMLGSTHDIKKTISRKQAESIMKRCIGSYTTPSVIFRSVSGKASLYMMGSSVSKKRDSDEKREEERRKRESEKKAQKDKAAELDTLKEEDDEGERPSYFGLVNLETGKCTRGKAIVAP
jgi:hypothetical protein